MTYKILITSIGGELGPQNCELLKAIRIPPKVEVIGIDASEDIIGHHFVDYYQTVPKGNQDSYISRILEIVDKYHIDLVLPCSDEEALSIAKHSDQFPKWCFLACPSKSVITVLNNKVDTYKALKAHNVVLPEWREAINPDELKENLNDLLTRHDCVVVKPSNARGSRNVYIVTNDDLMNSYYFATPYYVSYKNFNHNVLPKLSFKSPYILMQRLSGPIYDIDILAWHGELIQAVPRKRINSSDPNAGHEIVFDTVLLELAENITRIFNLHALVDCDVMFDDQNHPYVLEINPRPSGSISVSITAGMPFYQNLIALTLGNSIKKTSEDDLISKQVIAYKGLKAL